MPQPQAIASIDACVERIVEACGEHVVLATPLLAQGRDMGGGKDEA